MKQSPAETGPIFSEPISQSGLDNHAWYLNVSNGIDSEALSRKSEVV